jgi:hypothetical protein
VPINSRGSLAGVAAVEFRRTTRLLAADKAPVTLIARDLVPTGRDFCH